LAQSEKQGEKGINIPWNILKRNLLVIDSAIDVECDYSGLTRGTRDAFQFDDVAKIVKALFGENLVLRLEWLELFTPFQRSKQLLLGLEDVVCICS
jgi:hypothetical protein